MDVLPGIPRLYTALIEWAACLLYIIPLKKRVKGPRLILLSAAGLAVLCGVQHIAGTLPIYLWMAGMMTAVAAMLCFILMCCDLSVMDAGFCCVRAFILAEFAASLEWQIHYFFFTDGRAAGVLPILLMLSVYGAVFVIAYLLESRHLPRYGRLDVDARELWSAALMGVAIFLMSNISFVYQNTPFSVMDSSIFYVRTLVDFAGIIMLYAQQEQRRETALRRELHAMDDVFRRQYGLYCMSKENDEHIARLHHDLKHQIDVIRAEADPEKRESYLTEMDHAIKRREAENKTGNSVLDTVLSYKALHCVEHDINFSCMADGRLLGFMETMDICTMFGNALENAVESAGHLSDPEKRVVSMTMFAQNDFMVLRVENYFEAELTMEDGLPVTTKKDARYHGYGIKSIRRTAEKYGGTLTISTDDNWFSLCVLIPLPR